MDITFHYFAVKTLAVQAGFSNDDAQRIATYSQYIDDFNWIMYIDCKNLPHDIKESDKYDLYVSSYLTHLNFNPPTSGFETIIDYIWLLNSNAQKFDVSPFHFIPKEKNRYSPEIRTVPAKIGDGSIISSMLHAARLNYISAKIDAREKALMRIGMLLHTFADTYAHQLFTGYNSWANNVEVTKVIDNITNKNITEEAIYEINEHTDKILQNISSYELDGDFLNIGHMWAKHVPDLTNVSFELLYKSTKDSKRDSIYSRNNTETFITASKHILNFLRNCLTKEDVIEIEWKPFAEKLKKGFLYQFPKKNIEEKLAKHWKSIFNNVQYSYSKKEVESTFYLDDCGDSEDKPSSPLGINYSPEFYNYTRLADEHLIYMYGNRPRK